MAISTYVRQLKSVEDMYNNIGRLGSINADGRYWKAMEAFQDEEFNRYYLMQHIATGERAIVPMNRIHNFY